jgi:hypothetical protein
MPDARAYGWCSLGPLAAEPSTFADDQLQGSGIIRTKGTVTLQGIHRPATGTGVSFGYSDGQNWLARIPRRLRVLSSVANPLTLTTEVSVGCLFTYFENRKPALSNPSARAENSDVPDVAWRAATLPITAAYVFQQCCTALGLTVSGGIPLTNAYVVDEFDLSAGYIEEMGKLAVSEGWFVRLNEAEQVVFVSKNQDGGSGPLLQRGDLIDFNPVNVGELPGEAVASRYTTARLVAPDLGSSTTAEEAAAALQKRNWEKDESTKVGSAVITSDTTSGISTTTYTYTIKDETLTSYDEKDRVTVRTTLRDTVAAEVASTWVSQTGAAGINYGQFKFQTTFEYNDPSDETAVTSETTTEWQPYIGYLSSFINQFKFSDGNLAVGYNPMTPALVRTETVSYDKDPVSGITKTTTQESVRRALTTYGSSQCIEVSQRAGTANEMLYAVAIGMGIVPGDTTVKIRTEREFGLQRRPSAAELSKSNNSKAPSVEEVSEIAWAIGSPQSQTYVELSPPYAPDDRIIYTPSTSNPTAYLPGDFTVVRSDAATKAANYARIENRLLLGNRAGVGIQILPELLPPTPFAPIYVRLNGCTAEYRVNGCAWTISSEGCTATTDLLFWNAVDAADMANVWFPTAPGLSSLPSTAAVTPSSNPLPANAVAIPAGFDLNRPNLTTLFSSILPSGVAPVWGNTAAPSKLYPPFNETVELRIGTGTGAVIEALDWGPSEVSLVGGVGVGAVIEPGIAAVVAEAGSMVLTGQAATVQAGVVIAGAAGGLRLTGQAATIVTYVAGSNTNRLAGLHLDGNVTDTKGGSWTASSTVTFITSGQKFGSGAASIPAGGWITKAWPATAATTIYQRNFAFRAWVKITTSTGYASILNSAEGYYSRFGAYIDNGQLKWTQIYGEGSLESQTFGTIPLNQWVFVEIGRLSGVIRGSVDGVVSANTLSMDPALYWEEYEEYYEISGGNIGIQIDDFEFMINEGPRTTNFTPPTAAFS